MSLTPFDVENKLSLLHEKEYVLLTGNATTGIYLILKALGLENKNIAIPNNVCMNVPIAVKLSNNSLNYLDISRDTLGLSVESLKENINDVDAVIAVHSYGCACEIEDIKRLCIKPDIPLIEDFAVSQGATINNRPVGSFGDISVTSFGAGKIIDSGHGGAILTNNRALFFEIVKIEKQLRIAAEENREKISQLGLSYKRLYNEYLGKDTHDYIPTFQRMVGDAQNSFLFKFDENYRELILRNLNGLEDNIKRRSENAKKFQHAFEKHISEKMAMFSPPNEAVYWRFNIFVNKDRNSLLKELLKKQFKVSSWYPPVDMLFESRIRSHVATPVCDWVGDVMLNLWVNQEVDNRYIHEIADSILTFVEGGRDERR